MIRTLIARSLIVTTVVIGGFGVAGTAFAEPKGGDSGGMGACPVVDSDDNGKESTTYVPHGTKMGGLTCNDGSWIYVKSVKPTAAAVTGGQLATTTARR